jgi:hypothetical protein
MMALLGSLAAVTPEMARQYRRKRRRWRVAIVVCACALFWYGTALRQRLTYTWQLAHVIRGFVGYGHHEAEFSPDGTRIVIAHLEQSKVLDWKSGHQISTLEHYGGRGISDFSPDGRIVSRFPDGKTGNRTAYIWSASHGRILGRVKLPEQVEVKRCYPSFSPDNKKIVAPCVDGLFTWDSSDSKNVGRIKISQNPDAPLPASMSWHPVTHEMTCVDADGKLLRIDLQKETATPLLPKQERAVKAAKWSPDGTRLVTIDREGSVAVWDAHSGAVIASLSEKEVLFARFSPDGRQIVTTRPRRDVVRAGRWAPPAWDRWTRIWDAESGQLIRELPTTAIVTLSPDWTFWVEAGPEGVRIARFDGSELCDFPGWFDGHGSTCVFSQDNRYLAYVNGSGLVAVWQHRDPIRSWTEWLTLYQFWMTVLAAAGVAWSAWRLKASRALPAPAGGESTGDCGRPT